MPVDAARHRLTVPSGSGSDPLAAARSKMSVPSSSSSSHLNRPTQYLARLTDIRQMDIQSALDQMKTLLSTRPHVVYKTSYYRKQTKNHWARDDPAFCALQLVFLVIASIAYSVSFRAPLIDGLAFLLYSLLFNWLGAGFLIATLAREVANRHLTVHQSSSHVRQSVEWLYAFDIHCNAFFPVFVLLCKWHILVLEWFLGVCEDLRHCLLPVDPLVMFWTRTSYIDHCHSFILFWFVFLQTEYNSFSYLWCWESP